MSDQKKKTTRAILLYLTAVSAAFLLASLFAGPVHSLLKGFWAIQTSPQALTVDACAVGGLNGALLNAGVLGLIAVGLFAVTRAQLASVSIGAYFLTIGMSFFGKNCLNCWPIMLGTWLCYRLQGQKFSNHVHFALFATSLGPFVSEMLFSRYIEMPFGLAIAAAMLIGVLIGLILPPLSVHAFSMHKGYNLYNVGLSAGILAFVLFSIYRTAVLRPLGVETLFTLNNIFSEGYPRFFEPFLCTLFLGIGLTGLVMNRLSLRGLPYILRHSGHGVDFLWHAGLPAVLMNQGALGLMGIVYFYIIGAPLTGPTVGALLCMVCWAGSGTHLGNTYPIVLGYILVSAFAEWKINAQAVAVGVCFATGLAPIAGRWGVGWGILAGALHACCVVYTPAIHGGFNIYNGGFTSGLVAIVMVPVLESFFRERAEKREQMDELRAIADRVRDPERMS